MGGGAGARASEPRRSVLRGIADFQVTATEAHVHNRVPTKKEGQESNLIRWANGATCSFESRGERKIDRGNCQSSSVRKISPLSDKEEGGETRG